MSNPERMTTSTTMHMRYAVIRDRGSDLKTIRSYLYGNYEAVTDGRNIWIYGVDNAGFTLEALIERLASGIHIAKEVTGGFDRILFMNGDDLQQWADDTEALNTVTANIHDTIITVDGGSDGTQYGMVQLISTSRLRQECVMPVYVFEEKLLSEEDDRAYWQRVMSWVAEQIVEARGDS